jgi:hypothetical protein
MVAEHGILMRLDLVEEVVALPGREVRLFRPRDAEALLSDDAFEHEEFLPYWASLWPSARVLAEVVVLASELSPDVDPAQAAGAFKDAMYPRTSAAGSE